LECLLSNSWGKVQILVDANIIYSSWGQREKQSETVDFTGEGFYFTVKGVVVSTLQRSLYLALSESRAVCTRTGEFPRPPKCHAAPYPGPMCHSRQTGVSPSSHFHKGTTDHTQLSLKSASI
jgi:hypothetical protein